MTERGQMPAEVAAMLAEKMCYSTPKELFDL
jgi:hypothetical protein